MKKVLIIGHFWPYHQGGSKRIIGLAKYLSEFGWEPLILTGFLQNKPEQKFRYIETESTNAIQSFKKKLKLNPAKGIQEQVGVPAAIRGERNYFITKFIKLIEGIVTYPDVERGWKPFAIKAAEDLIKKEKIDAIISVWPITANLIAQELKERYNIPWIADFPDLWAETYAYRYGPVRKYFDRKLEKKTLTSADVLTTSSFPQEIVLRKMHSEKKVHTITIGFSPDMVNEPPLSLTKKFTITYTGVFYGKERNPLKFLKALAELVSSKRIDSSDVEVSFYGSKDEKVEADIKNLGLAGVVKQSGAIPWEACIQKQRESQLLLHLNWENKKEKGAYSGKISEYLAAFRPIISVGGWGNDVIDDLFKQTKAGAYCTGIEETKEALLKFYDEYKKKARVDFHGDIGEINKYSYREMAKEFAGVLNSIM